MAWGHARAANVMESQGHLKMATIAMMKAGASHPVLAPLIKKTQTIAVMEAGNAHQGDIAKEQPAEELMIDQFIPFYWFSSLCGLSASAFNCKIYI